MHTLGNNIFKRFTFQCKEFFKSKKGLLYNFLLSIPYTFNKFMHIYDEYVWIILLITWCFMMTFFSQYYIFVTTLTITVSLVTLLTRYINDKKEEFYLSTNFESSIKELDNLISDCIQEYMILNGYADGNNHIFTEAEETKIREETANLVSIKISNILYNKLCNMYKKESVPDIIGTRIYIIITRFIFDLNNKQNESKKAQEQIEQINLFK